MGGADLHTHSTASDGECPPPELVRRAGAAAVAVLALTDHDTMAGVPAAQAAARDVGVRVVAGCEFSVRAPWGELHLLGYFLPGEDAPLDAFLTTQRAHRAARMAEIARRLARSGVPVDLDAIAALAGGATLGRPHAARAVVRAGAARDVGDAFARYLGRGRPAFVPKELPDLVAAVELVRASGGVTSAAHLKERAGRRTVHLLREAGVDALEVRHPSHDGATEARIARLADEAGMLPSGGSDWHGDARARDDGRAGLGEVTVPLGWFERLERLHIERRDATRTR